MANEPKPFPFPQQPEVSSFKMVAVMGSVGLIASILLVVTFQLTGPRIEANRRAYLESAVLTVLPGATRFQAFRPTEENALVLVEEGEKPALQFYAGYDGDDALIGIAIEAQGQGYADVVRILYGYNPSCACVVGLKVLESKETPGLGDKISRDPAFLSNFEALEVKMSADGLQIEQEVELVKSGAKTGPWQIEAITGATISSRAVTDIIRASTEALLPLIQQNLATLEAGS